jgi:hypothetical protein
MFAFPRLTKTWQLTPNIVADTGTGQAATMFRAIKDALLGFGTLPWTCQGSSDSSTAALDGVDRLTSNGAIVAASSGAHSWIVLKQPATGLQVCIDWLTTHGNVYYISVVISVAAGFTGGTITARPTATDEIEIRNDYWHYPTEAWVHVTHVLHSTDGKNTRIVAQVFNGGTDNRALLWEFGRAGSPITEWTTPLIGCIVNLEFESTSIWPLLAPRAGTPYFYGKAPSGTTMQMFAVAPGSFLLNKPATVTGGADALVDPNVPVLSDGDYPLHELGLVSITSSCKGKHGKLVDLWGTIGANDGYFVSPDRERALLSIGGLVFPWQVGLNPRVE